MDSTELTETSDATELRENALPALATEAMLTALPRQPKHSSENRDIADNMERGA
tara:strand:+ start:595 stop:756 length:162 start_codon:yes stop_codon:yes gene_type:complete